MDDELLSLQRMVRERQCLMMQMYLVLFVYQPYGLKF
jgi:hypothetical protein